jgi:hypothetical protein
VSAFVHEVHEYETDDGRGNKTRHKRTSLKKRPKLKMPFGLIFFEDLGRLYDLQDNQLKVLVHVVRNMDYDNIVRVTGYDRKEWSKEIGITHQTFNVALSRLLGHGILLAKGNGAYQIDPELFNMGSIDSSLEKAESYNASFEISYTLTQNGVKRKVKRLKVDVVDPETGEVK